MPHQTPPAPYGPVPSARQLAWHERPFYGFIHFTLNTWTDREWGYGDESPELFDPTDLDCRQWARIAADCGMGGLILTAKHHDGFCLWPSKHTEHSVKNAPWKDGQGDVVREFVDACAEYGIAAGLYLSPWDRNHAEYGRDAYVDYYHAQLRELLTEYGDLFACWFDGANGGDGYYGGARETRQIDREHYYRWPDIVATVRELQPHAVIFSDAGPDMRWVGNERGFAPEVHWSTMNAAGLYPGFGGSAILPEGQRDGDTWLPAETDVSIRPGWFWHESENHAVKTVDHLFDIYMRSVGHGTSLNLNLPPDRRGRIHEHDEAALRELAQRLDGPMARDLAADAVAAASSVHLDGHAAFGPAKAVDGLADSYWAAAEGDRRPTITVTLGDVRRVSCIGLAEYLPLGQRVDRFRLEYHDGQSWIVYAEGANIGARRYVRGPAVYTDRLRLVVTAAAAPPCIRAIHAWSFPDAGLAAPRFETQLDGSIAIQPPSGADETRYSIDGAEPTHQDAEVAGSVALPRGGVLKARAWRDGIPGPTAIRVYGLPSSAWHVIGASSTAAGHEPGHLLQHDAVGWLSLGGAHLPQHLDLDLGASQTFSSIVYQPLDSGLGLITSYRIYASDSPDEWGAPIAVGEFGNMANDPSPRRVSLTDSVQARYLRIEATASTDGQAGIATLELHA